MGPTWVLSAPDGPHVGPINLAIRVHNFNVPENESSDLVSYVEQFNAMVIWNK